jgi:hypothetical protein
MSSRTPADTPGTVRVAEEHGMQGATGGVEESRPVPLHFSILQNVEAEAVPIETEASPEVARRDYAVMNA